MDAKNKAGQSALRTAALFIGCSFALWVLAHYVQYVIDQSYNQGRDNERICRDISTLEMCKRHNRAAMHPWRSSVFWIGF